MNGEHAETYEEPKLPEQSRGPSKPPIGDESDASMNRKYLFLFYLHFTFFRLSDLQTNYIILAGHFRRKNFHFFLFI